MTACVSYSPQTLLSCLLLILAIQSSLAQVDLEFERDGQLLNMEERMALDRTQGVAMVVLHDGAVLLQQNWGYQDTEAARPLTDESVFQVGSLSQVLTKFAVLQLVSRGVFELDTDINEYLMSWKLPSTAVTRRHPVTIRDLMLHRRGFRFPYKPAGFAAGEPLPTLLDMLNGEGAATNPPVRLKKNRNRSGNHTYAGVLIMQQMLEDYYQLPFAELMAQEVLQPLGMSHSFFASALTKAQHRRLAVGYQNKGQRLADDYRRYAAQSASGLYTTASDWASFVQYTLDACTARDNRLLSEAVAQEAMFPAKAKDALLFNKSESEYFWGGAAKGYYTQFAADAVDQRWVVVAFMNDDLNWGFNGELRYQGKQLVEEAAAAEQQVEQERE